jgi:hypothetical protein
VEHLPLILVVPLPVQMFGRGSQLDDQIICQILGLDFAA